MTVGTARMTYCEVMESSCASMSACVHGLAYEYSKHLHTVNQYTLHRRFGRKIFLFHSECVRSIWIVLCFEFDLIPLLLFNRFIYLIQAIDDERNSFKSLAKPNKRQRKEKSKTWLVNHRKMKRNTPKFSMNWIHYGTSSEILSRIFHNWNWIWRSTSKFKLTSQSNVFNLNLRVRITCPECILQLAIGNHTRAHLERLENVDWIWFTIFLIFVFVHSTER